MLPADYLMVMANNGDTMVKETVGEVPKSFAAKGLI